MWKIINIFKTIIFFIILAIGSIAILSTTNTNIAQKIPFKPYAVTSGSMQPAIMQGSVVFIKRGVKNLSQGDIITFIRPDKPRENVTHRIIGIEKIEGKIIFRTKGDANKTADAWVIRPDAVWGKVIFSIPYLGYIINFSKTKTGVIFTVALPLTIIIFDELRIIYLEINKIKKRREEKQKSSAAKIVSIVIISTTFFLISSTPSLAYFSDSVTVSSLKIQTSNWNHPKGCGDISITTNNNGTGSKSTTTVFQNCNTTVNQSNNITSENYITISSSTGNNVNGNENNAETSSGNSITKVIIQNNSGTNSMNNDR